jgi:hypothetical protein
MPLGPIDRFESISGDRPGQAERRHHHALPVTTRVDFAELVDVAES